MALDWSKSPQGGSGRQSFSKRGIGHMLINVLIAFAVKASMMHIVNNAIKVGYKIKE